MSYPVEVIPADVIVVGGGLSGARAAVEAHEHKARVVMVMKGGFGRGGASAMPNWWGGYNVPNGDCDPLDNPEEEFKDIMKWGAGMCDEKLARLLAYESEERLKDLERWGLDTIVKIDGKYLQSMASFLGRRRIVRTAGLGIAPSMLRVLKRESEKRGVKVIDNVAIVSLLTHRGNCVGALGVNEHGGFLVFRAKSTVLATGGATALFSCASHLPGLAKGFQVLATGGAGASFSRSMYPRDATGDGYALGFHAGAELANMEFIQIFLRGVHGHLLLLHPEIYNKLGERFLSRYLPRGVTPEECLNQKASKNPFTTADNSKYLDIAVYREALDGRGTEKMGIYVDFTRLSQGDLEKSIQAAKGGLFEGGIETQLKLLDARGINIFKKPLEVIPYANTFNGGFRIDERTETTLPGLYAIGEAATGPHGADRLGGNMVAACQVFGARAGRFAAEKANSINEVTIDEEQVNEECGRVSRLMGNKGTIKPQEMESKIGDIMWRNCLTVRNRKGLERCVDELRRLRREELPRLSVEANADLFRALAIPNLLDVGEIVASSALQRQESRGSHFREDFPDRDDVRWLKTINLSKENFHPG